MHGLPLTLEHDAQVLTDSTTPLLWNLMNLRRYGLLQLMNDFEIIPIDIGRNPWGSGLVSVKPIQGHDSD